MTAALSVSTLRRYALARTLFRPTTLLRAVRRLGFVQADPIRAPARAQDLILRLRVRDYAAGDLERRYPRLPLEEDCLVNYGFLPRETLALLHPRTPKPKHAWDAATAAQAAEIAAFVRTQGTVHPRQVAAHFAHGSAENYWGGRGQLSTRLLEGLHYRGQLRVAGRAQGIRLYQTAQHPPQDDSPTAKAGRAQALLALVLHTYAPLPDASLGYLAGLLDYGAPHLRAAIRTALQQARRNWPQARINGVTWYWTAEEDPQTCRWREDGRVRLLAPFDPLVWDRRRFALFWGWEYKFEAYVPAAKRRYGYYALPMLWRGDIIGWANVRQEGGAVAAECGYVAGAAPSDAAFAGALEAELARFEQFLCI
ncbi:uncharacterized protein YcaQ [Neisseria sp. HSC-16F19]|nr:crosslink repair DNA glycosylase YcaQ family protein [Neisseria sp. HSC-16F19]MCP2041403.1 uncharacterized protein YcaQ [Neisseria sp. HSC-16F19]